LKDKPRNRLFIKSRLIYSVTIALVFSLFFELLDVFNGEPFDPLFALVSFIIFGFITFNLSYFYLKFKN